MGPLRDLCGLLVSGLLGYLNDKWLFDVGLFGELSLVSGRLLTPVFRRLSYRFRTSERPDLGLC